MNFESSPAERPKSENEQKKEIILALQAELDELNMWQKHWTEGDRKRAEDLKNKISGLKKEVGDYSELLDKMGV